MVCCVILYYIFTLFNCYVKQASEKREVLNCWGAGKCQNTSVNVLVRMMAYACSVPFALTMFTIHSLSTRHQLALASADDWFTKGRVMCFHVYVIMNACKRSLAICCKNRVSCPVIKLMSVPTYIVVFLC